MYCSLELDRFVAVSSGIFCCRKEFSFLCAEIFNNKGKLFFSDIVIYAPKHLHNKFEEGEIKYDGNYDTDKIKKFIEHDM